MIILLFGATGPAGGGVLDACLAAPYSTKPYSALTSSPRGSARVLAGSSAANLTISSPPVRPAGTKRIKHRDVEMCEIALVSRGHRQPVYPRRRRNHRVFRKRLRAAMHQPRVFPEARRIHR